MNYTSGNSWCIHGVPYGPTWVCSQCAGKVRTPESTAAWTLANANQRIAVLEAEVAGLRGKLDAAEARLVEAEGSSERLGSALESMTRQFAYWSSHAGGYTTGGLSALQEAFAALGWENPHPAPEARCEIDGCLGQGTSVHRGSRLCGEHWRTAELEEADR